ncbi:MAG: polyphosphate kinase 2, partial [Betaproteobacteria bacterium]
MSATRQKARGADPLPQAIAVQAEVAGPGHHKAPAISHKEYKAELKDLQIELVKLQRHFIGHGDKILVLLEGRDSAGKDGSIKRIVAHLSPRDTRVVALGKPSDRDLRGWYFSRYIAELPVAEELVLFNRSWYNRAGVELVMGFCSKKEYREFLHSAPRFEQMLVDSGIKLLKYYLDISKDEQKARLADRKRDPLKQWKSSPID